MVKRVSVYHLPQAAPIAQPPQLHATAPRLAFLYFPHLREPGLFAGAALPRYASPVILSQMRAAMFHLPFPSPFLAFTCTGPSLPPFLRLPLCSHILKSFFPRS